MSSAALAAAKPAFAADSGRIAKRFAKLKQEGRGGLVTFTTAGDPDFDTSLEILKGLPAAGADVIELGMPFSDPMADGPAIQASSLRALNNGMTLKKTLELARKFRAGEADTPLIMMGYYNPIYQYGVDRFLADFKAAGGDGLIIVDLPPEEDDELCLPALKTGVNFIRLATSTMSQSWASPERARRPTPTSRPPCNASSATPTCRWRSASASGRRNRRPPWREWPMRPLSVRRLSAASLTGLTESARRSPVLPPTC
jgi:hypothetical protein